MIVRLINRSVFAFRSSATRKRGRSKIEEIHLSLNFIASRNVCVRRRTGDKSEEGTPVPISNTVVKLFSSEDTVWATAWENKTLPFRPLTWAFFLPVHSS